MPPLPKKRKTKEADVTPDVMAWFQKHYPFSVALEIKVDKNKVLPHQATALESVEKGHFSYKLPDSGKRNPFDCVILKNAHAFVVRCEGRKCIAYRVDGSKAFPLSL